ncbi:MAG: RodZ domain-containing protein [Vicinamibacterales bacterium]
MSSEGDKDRPSTEMARRLRDEVRAEAQREADAIISKARSDIKEIVSSAYSELLVLRAQVQAISDEKVDQTLPASVTQFEVDAENLRRQLGHSGVEDAPAGPRAALPPPGSEPELEPEPEPEPEPEWAPAREPQPVFATSYVDRADRRPSRRLVPTAAALAILAIAALWFFVRDDGSETQFTEPDPVSTPAPAEPAAAPPISAPETAPADPAPGTATAPGTDAAPGSAFPAGTVTLELRATRSVWVRADVDGDRDNGRIYDAGATWTIGPAKSVALRVGDGGALSVAVNGGEAAAAGADGVVVNRRYGEASAAEPQPDEPAAAPAQTTQPTTVAAAPVTPRPTPAAAPPISSPAPATPATQRPTPPPAQQAAQAQPQPAPPADPAARLDAEIRGLDRRWFEASYRGDEAALRTLRAPSFQVNDSRGPLTRPAQGATVQRRLGRAGVTMVGNDAVLAGRMIEEVAGGSALESLFSEIWVRTGDGWRLSELRIQPAPPPTETQPQP